MLLPHTNAKSFFAKSPATPCNVKMNLIYETFQCISTIAFVKNEGEVLDSPIWIMLINIVALEMLGAKMPKPTGIGISILVIIP